MMLLANGGALVTALLGCLGMLFPAAVCRVLSVGRRREPFVAKCGWHPFRGERRRGDVGRDALATRCCGIAMNPSGVTTLLIASH